MSAMEDNIGDQSAPNVVLNGSDREEEVGDNSSTPIQPVNGDDSIEIEEVKDSIVPEQAHSEEAVSNINDVESIRGTSFTEIKVSEVEQDSNEQNTGTYRDEGSESVGSEQQEVKIEYLAQALAENLHREHPAAHFFTFEEFETEQEYVQYQERLQLHLYQQHVLHQQEMQRQNDRTRQQHLSLDMPDSSRYSSHPSPGSKFFKQHVPQSPSGTVRTDRTAQSQNTTAWYRAEEAANFVNRAGSPCSRKDRLYEAMPYQYFEKDFLHSKYAPQFPHQPTLISKATTRPEDNREGFFQRLYQTHFDQMSQMDGARRQTDQHIIQVGNTVHPRVLTEAERTEVTNRLLFHKDYMNRKFEAQRTGVSNALKEQQNGRFVDKKSHQLVAQTQRNALSEIFDVLLVTAQMERERNAAQQPRADFLDRDGTPVETGELVQDEPSAQQIKTSLLKDVLDTSLAQARFLQPKQLSDAIGVILDALNPRSVSRKQFVEFTLHCMNKTYQIQPKKASSQPNSPSKPPTATSPAESTQPSPLNMTAHLAAGTPPTGPQNPLLFPVHVRAGTHTASSLTPLDTSEHAEDGPATEAVEYMREPYSPSSSVRARSRTSSPAHTPRANRSSMLRTTLASPASQARARTPSRTSSKQNLYERDAVDADRTPVEVPVSSMPVMIPPIGYLLVAASTGGSGTASQREREEGTQAQREYREHFTGRPHLVASKTTEKLVKQRYPERVKGQQKVEDSLLAYGEQKRNNNLQRSIELDRVTSRDCTFQPNINSPYMLRFKSTGREVPEHKNVRTMIRRSASRSRAASSGEGQPESQADNQTDTSLSVDSDLLSAGLRGEPAGGSSSGAGTCSGSNSGRRSVNTRPEVLGSEGFQAAPAVPYLDQKEVLGFRSRSNSANNLRRSGSNPRMRPQMEEIPLSAGPSDYMHFDEEYLPNQYDQQYVSPQVSQPSPSGARTAAVSALYRSQNGFVSDPSAARRLARTTTAPGRFSYSAAAQHAAEQVYSYQNQYQRQSPRPSPGQSPNLYQGDRNLRQNNNSQFYPSARGAAAAMQQGPSPRTQQASHPLYQTSPRSLHSAPHSPRTATPAEYKLTEEALHRKMYKDLYYNF